MDLTIKLTEISEKIINNLKFQFINLHGKCLLIMAVQIKIWTLFKKHIYIICLENI